MEKTLSLSTGELYIDDASKTLYVKFFGEMILEEYQIILLKAEQAILENRLSKVIDDRSEVYDHPIDCRFWYEYAFLHDNFVNITPLVDKIALIKSQTQLGQVHTDILEKTLMIALESNFDLQFAAFDLVKDAEDWMKKELLHV